MWENLKKSEWSEHRYDIVFGADGAFSRVRHKDATS